MPTQAKREMIDSLAELLKKSDAVFITEYRGLSVKKISACRRSIRQAGGEMKVCKNTLMRIALAECGMVQAPELDFGPNGYVLSYGDAAAVAANPGTTPVTNAVQGANDAAMLRAAALGVCVLSTEGAAAVTLAAADIVVPDILSALALFDRPLRIVATLRT